MHEKLKERTPIFFFLTFIFINLVFSNQIYCDSNFKCKKGFICCYNDNNFASHCCLQDSVCTKDGCYKSKSINIGLIIGLIGIFLFLVCILVWRNIYKRKQNRSRNYIKNNDSNSANNLNEIVLCIIYSKKDINKGIPMNNSDMILKNIKAIDFENIKKNSTSQNKNQISFIIQKNNFVSSEIQKNNN